MVAPVLRTIDPVDRSFGLRRKRKRHGLLPRTRPGLLHCSLVFKWYRYWRVGSDRLATPTS